MGRRILIVDDNEETLETLCLMTKNMALGRVSGFRSVADTLAFLSQHPDIDLIICDWNMPQQTGLDLLKILREKGNPVHFIMVTGRNDLNSVLEARSHGVDLYISKPFSMDELQQKIKWVDKFRSQSIESREFND